MIARGVVVLVAILLASCSNVYPIAKRDPWFATEHDLAAKAALLHDETMKLVTPAGLLLYRAHEPLDDRENYLKSHDLADAPAWQGYLLAALAFEEAVIGRDRDPEILRLARGLATFYDVTGVPGLFARSMTPEYDGPRKAWMHTPEARPTKHWRQGPTGRWFRTGLAKGHFVLACFGLGIPLALERRGDIELRAETHDALIETLVPAVRRFIANDFRLCDFDGAPTEYGNLRPQWLNTFNSVVALSVLASAAPYDERIAETYEEKLDAWTSGAWTLDVLGRLIRSVGHRWIGKPSYSDMQLIALGATAFLLQEDRREYRRYARNALTGLWHFVEQERNAPFTICYAALVRNREGTARIEEIIEDLHDFPISKRPSTSGRESTGSVQPLSNRPISTNYWKSSPFRVVRKPVGPPNGIVYGGQDYLLAYWMGRYFGLVPAH